MNIKVPEVTAAQLCDAVLKHLEAGRLEVLKVVANKEFCSVMNEDFRSKVTREVGDQVEATYETLREQIRLSATNIKKDMDLLSEYDDNFQEYIALIEEDWFIEGFIRGYLYLKEFKNNER